MTAEKLAELIKNLLIAQNIDTVAYTNKTSLKIEWDNKRFKLNIHDITSGLKKIQTINDTYLLKD